MDFDEARIGMSVLEKHGSKQLRDWGDEANRKLPISGHFDFEHDQCWISLPRTTSDPELTPEERKMLEDAGWFFDKEVGAWSHF